MKYSINLLIASALCCLISVCAHASRVLLQDRNNSVTWDEDYCAASTTITVRSLYAEDLIREQRLLNSLLGTAAAAISFECAELDQLNYVVMDTETTATLESGSANRESGWRTQPGENRSFNENTSALNTDYRVAGIELGMSFEAARAQMREQFGEEPAYRSRKRLLVSRYGHCRADQRKHFPRTYSDREDQMGGIDHRCLRVWLSHGDDPVVEKVVLVHELPREFGSELDDALVQRFGAVAERTPIIDPEGHGYHIIQARRLGWGHRQSAVYDLEAEIVERVDATRVVLTLGG